MEENGKAEKGGAVLSFHHINYTVQLKAPGCCKTAPKQILKDVSGIFKPGINAIMGPTGCGKSSLLDTLAGRKDPAGLEGHVLVDGRRQPKNFKCMSGYVVQDDIVFGTLTVRENLMFSANLRLSTKISQSVKEQRVADCIEELGLTRCADTKVGNEFIRGVSGGERKRCNIGMELIIAPSVLFLDEPTTGLDASTAGAVMTLLHTLSRKGRTIIYSIHQPRYSIYRLFDRLMLLSKGQIIYHGVAQDALTFFNDCGYECESFNNPPDFFLDVINGDNSAVKTMESNDKAVNSTNGFSNIAFTDDDDKSGNTTVVPMDVVDEPQDLTQKLHSNFNKSSWASTLGQELQVIFSDFESHKNDNDNEILADYATGFFTQLRYVGGRTVTNLLRNPQSSVLQIIVMIVFALLTGIIYLRLDDSVEYGLMNRYGCFFFIIMNMVFSNLTAIDLFIKERVLFIHENVSGFYRTSAYFMAKLFCDLLPMRVVPLLIYTVIAYFMVGLDSDAGKFFFFFFNLTLTTLAAVSICFLLSASTAVFLIANLLCVLIFVLMMIFGGLLVSLESLGSWLSWLKYFSIFRYSLSALAINELKDQTFCVYLANGTKTVCNSNQGNEFLTLQGISHETTWDLWSNELALVCISVGFFVLAYIRLLFVNKYK